MAHLKNFKRMALVGDQTWITRFSSLPNPISLEIKRFDDDQENEALHEPLQALIHHFQSYFAPHAVVRITL